MAQIKELTEIDFLYLKESVYELERALTPEPKGNTIFPLLKGKTLREEETVELGDVFKASLTAVDNAARKLKEKGISLASQPIEIKLSGSLVGISPNADRILIKVKPERK